MNLQMLAILAATVVSSASQGSAQPAPDPIVIEQLELLQREKPSKLRFYEAVIELREIVRLTSRRHVLEQAAWMSASQEDWTVFNYAVWQLQLGDDYFVTKVLAPYLESPDRSMRTFAETYLENRTALPEKRAGEGKIDGLIQHVAEGHEAPGRAAQILYWQAPSAALVGIAQQAQILANDDERRQIYWAEHVVSAVIWKQRHGFLSPTDVATAQAELDKLSRDGRWWVKLYVAEMLRRHELFRREDIVARLRSDPNPMIAKALDRPINEE